MLGIQERMRVVSIDLDILARTYFYFDIPVDYKLKEKTIKIYPVSVKDSEFFLSSINLLSIDKNSMPSVEIIQMSYLQFIFDILIPQKKDNLQKLINLLKLCLHINDPRIKKDSGKYILIDGENNFTINGQQFEDIRRIILYQNLINFDDSYINPDLKQAINDVDELKNKGIEPVSIERKMAIVSAHTGISKKEQMEMSYRSYSLLFEEVYGEVEYTTVYPIALLGGNKDNLDKWIYKKKKNKIDDYITQVDKYTQSMGGNQNAIKSTGVQQSNNYLQQFNDFIK